MKRRERLALSAALPYIGPVHTVVETPTYLAAIRKVGLSGKERDAVLDQVMTNPEAGDLVRGSGGIRKVRVGKDDGGKSGGYRALTYYMDRSAPAFLLFVLDKTDADTITDAQVKVLRRLAKTIKDERLSADQRRRKS